MLVPDPKSGEEGMRQESDPFPSAAAPATVTGEVVHATGRKAGKAGHRGASPLSASRETCHHLNLVQKLAYGLGSDTADGVIRSRSGPWHGVLGFCWRAPVP